MWIKTTSSTAETYNINISTFKDVQPEEFLALLKNFEIEIDGTGTTSLSGKINYLHTMLLGASLREFDKLSSQNHGATNDHLKHIMDGLLGYFFPISAFSKKNLTMRRAIRKP